MKKIFGSFSVLALGFGLMSCSDNSLESKDLNVNAKGNLLVSVRDVNGVVLTAADSVHVTLLNIDKKPRATDSLGLVLYRKLQVGNYSVLVERNGYASMVCPTAIVMAASDETPIAADMSLDVYMHKLGANVNGVAVRANNANINGTESVPAADAVVRLTMNGGACEFVNNTQIATVATDGSYSFADLPELAAFQIIPEAMTIGDELNLGNTVSSATGRVGQNIKINQIAYAVNADPFIIVSSNKRSVAIGDSIVVNFSKSVDVSRIRKDDIKTSNNVAIATAWSNDNKTLTVKSATTKWLAGSNFDLIFDVVSVYGQGIQALSTNTMNVAIYTQGDLGSVVGLAATDKMDTLLNYSSTDVDLIWNKLVNASGYEVYRKKSTDSSFVLVNTLTGNNDTAVTVSANDFADAKSVQLLVVGTNSVGRSPFVLTEAKAFFDKVKPAQSLAYVAQSAATSTTLPGTSSYDWVFESVDADVTASITNKELTNLYTLEINFTEPMDTTVFATATNVSVKIDGTETSSDLLTFTKKWSANGQKLTITPYVVAGKAASNVALRVNVSFAGVTDKRGNVMATVSNNVSVLYKHTTGL